MSGTNPFRRKPIDPLSTRSFESSGQKDNVHGFPPVNTDIPPTSKSKPVKTVRIISPPSIESDKASIDSEDEESGLRQSLFSPPPPPPQKPAVEEDEGQYMRNDPFGGTPSSDDDDTASAASSDAVSQEYSLAQPQTLAAAPSNPFRASVGKPNGALPDSAALMASDGRPSKSQFDVDGFKNLLLTGERSGETAENRTTVSPLTKAPTITFGQSQSGADDDTLNRTSSITRSLTESSASNVDGTSECFERFQPQQLQSSVTPASTTKPGKAKPSTPRHRHGKLMEAVNMPETVSFESPAFVTFDENANPDAKAHRVTPFPDLSPGQGFRDTADQDGASGEVNSRPQSESFVEGSQSSGKRVPPAPPTSRRAGQGRPTSMNSMVDRPGLPDRIPSTSEISSLSSSPPSSSISAPPPPPPRRSGTVHMASSSSIPTIASITSLSDQSVGGHSPKPIPKGRQPGIPIRNSNAIPTGATSSNWSPSGSPSKSAPAPPPSRRRGSSQSSLAASRLSGDYRAAAERLRSDSGASSISHLAMTTSVGESGPERQDVMADLSALQREVDELRGKIKD